MQHVPRHMIVFFKADNIWIFYLVNDG